MSAAEEITMAGELSFFELGVEDSDRGRAFYTALFGWTFEPGPSEAGGLVIRGAAVPGGIHGDDPGASPYVFFSVPDIDAAVTRVQELGGAVDDVDVEGDADSQRIYGRFRLCRDDQGSAFGLHEPPRPAT
jgi:predicted enzyme related to lactoylglutathione lyase